jgi:predicted small integral membrane protein
MVSSSWTKLIAAIATVFLGALALLIWAVPRGEDGFGWTDSMIPGGWMAWTFPVALFFWCIAALLTLFTILAIRFPETPRLGILRIETTRGDRLFITLLGSAFLHLATLGLLGADLIWVGPIHCLAYAAAVFRWV